MSKVIKMICEVCGQTWDAVFIHRYDDGNPEIKLSLCQDCFEKR